MTVQKILREQKKRILECEKVFDSLRGETKDFVELIEEELKRERINASVFVGGSFAKGTLLKTDKHDVDVYLRFNWKLNGISELLEKILEKISKREALEIRKLHGSRDYFFVIREGTKFEVIPVYAIKKPNEARNVTDLSYFHVNYVKKKLRRKKGLAEDILLAKRFFKAQRIYGAEGYIQGFSGYGVECLVIHYGSFLKMLRDLAKVKERIVLDPEKLFRNKNDVLFGLNESKLQSPIVLVDPTWKERNVLAALSHETFVKFQEQARKFLKSPSGKYFENDGIDFGKLERMAKTKKGEFVHVKLRTDRQEGDIAGTKLRKFSDYLAFELRKYFDIFSKEFEYGLGLEGDFYLVLKSRGRVVKIGPPVKMKKHAKNFRKKNRKVVERKGFLYSNVKIDFSAGEFLRGLGKKEKVKIKEMGIVGMTVS